MIEKDNTIMPMSNHAKNPVLETHIVRKGEEKLKLDFSRALSWYGVRRAYNIFMIQKMLYNNADKILEGYDLRITGDIDEPQLFIEDSSILEEWIGLASEIGTLPPSLYVTVVDSETFGKMKQLITDINPKIVIGAHGIRHIHYSQHREWKGDIIECRKYSDRFRFPYLDYNRELLLTAIRNFNVESSITSDTMHPFKIGNCIEYPITPPSDTYYRTNPLDERVVREYAWLVEKSKELNRCCTFLFHPNPWSNQLMRVLKDEL